MFKEKKKRICVEVKGQLPKVRRANADGEVEGRPGELRCTAQSGVARDPVHC